MRKIITIILALTLIMGLSVAGASAKAKKPAKVTALKATSQKFQITLTWKKAKRAKKYQVYQLSGKKFVKVRTTKARKAVFNSLKMDTAYKFKVRGIKGKKKGKFSKVITVRTKKSVFHSAPVHPGKDENVKFIKGDTYIIETDSGEEVKVTITGVSSGYDDVEGDKYTSYFGKTKDGGDYYYSKNKQKEMYSVSLFPYKNFSFNGIFDINNTFDNDLRSHVRQITVFDDSKIYWTLDGTMPKIGQEDLFGSSKLVPLYNSPDDDTITYKYMQLRGTATKGVNDIKVGDRDLGKEMIQWYIGYKDGKMIYEEKYHQFNYDN